MNPSFTRINITVFSTLLCASLAHAAPTLIKNVEGYTLQGQKLVTFNGMVYDDGKVVKIGDAKVLGKEFKKAKQIDGHGKTLLPGLIDAHGHVFRLGFKNSEVALVGTTTLATAQANIAAYAKAHPERQWILGGGWNQEIWKLGRFPTASELDKVVADRPVRLVRVDGHAAWLNSKALQLAGITRDTPNPAGGSIERDNAGNPSGVLVDKAMALVSAVIPPYTDAEKSTSLSAALQEFGSLGLTSVGDAGIGISEYAIYKQFADQGKLTTRIYAMIRDAGDDFKTLSKNGPLKGYAQDRLSVAAIKLYADGALGSRGAALLEPYSDDHNHSGLLFMDAASAQKNVEAGLKAGYQVNAHAIGDAANHELLDAFENAYKQVGGKDLRNRIEHAQVITLHDIPRFKELNLIASMQPTHATSDMNMAEDRLGKERLKGAYAWQTFLKQGTIIAGGSDFPVESANPFFGLHAAVTRTDHAGTPINGWRPEEAMTLTQAFRAFTLDAAYANHQEKVIGSLEKGKWADFILIDQNIFKIPAKDIWKTKVLKTWLAGELIYDVNSSQNK